MIRLGRRLVRRLWPRGRRARWVSAGVAVVVAAAAVAGGVAAASGPGPITARDVRISVTDGPRDDQHVVLDATFFTPSGTGRVPSILLAHGFGETKDDVPAGGGIPRPGRVRGSDVVGEGLRGVDRADRPRLPRVRGEGR